MWMFFPTKQRENLPEAVADVIQKCWKPREEVTLNSIDDKGNVTFSQEMLLKKYIFRHFKMLK